MHEVDPFTGAPANELSSRLYVDAQINYTLPMLNHGVTLTVGGNNLTDRDPPGCFTCSINNYDPTTYDIPGQFFYGRIAIKMGGAVRLRRPMSPPAPPPPPAMEPAPPAAEPAPPPPPPPAPAPERGN